MSRFTPRTLEGRRPTTPRRHVSDEGGFSMVEMVVAITLFALTATGVASLLGTSLRITGGNRSRAVAANLAAQEMDMVRSTEFTELPLGTINTDQQVDGELYTIRRETAWVDADATTGPCDAPPGSTLSFLRVSVSVRWAAIGGIEPPSSQTIVSPPVGSYDADSGHIAVSVVDRDGGPQSDVTVVTDGPSGSDTQVTTSDGCAFFAYRAAGAYTATISAAGHVDTVNAASATQSVTVVNGATTSAEFQFDAATTIQVDLRGVNGNPAADTVPVTIANSHIVPSGTAQFTGSGASRSLPDLFPWSDGYSVFAGGCADADPLGESAPGAPYWPGAVRPAPIEAVPGGLSPASVVMPEIEVEAEWDLGSGLEPAQGVTVEARHGTDDGCPMGETYDLGATDSNGFVNAALPYGTWTIWVDGAYADTVVLDPNSPSTLGSVWVDLT